MSHSRRNVYWRRETAEALAWYLLLCAAVLAVGHASARLFTFDVPPHGWPHHAWLEPLTRWDTGWYWQIAEFGYSYDGPGVQSAVAFFPAYPLAMRLGGRAVGDPIVAGAVITWLSGALAVILFRSWAEAKLGTRAARMGLVLLLCSPFAYFLAGAVYSDALFLAAALSAFVFFEQGAPIAAGLAGAVATAARPVGLAVMVGLLLVAAERRRGLELRDAGILLSALGLIAFCALLWWRFGDPLAFARVQTAAGWGRRLDWDTVLTADFFRRFQDHSPNLVHLGLSVQAALAIGAVALLPATFRRLGWGYGAYATFVVAGPLLTSSDFIAAGRYVLASFPTFAVAGSLLVETKPRWLAPSLVLASSGLAVVMTSLFAQWYLL